jgi:hypothetical protein
LPGSESGEAINFEPRAECVRSFPTSLSGIPPIVVPNKNGLILVGPNQKATEALLDEILVYLDTIAAINDVERKLTNRKGGSDRGENAAEIAKLGQVYDAAEAAWAAIPPEFRTRLYPPPARQTDGNGPATATGS